MFITTKPFFTFSLRVGTADWGIVELRTQGDFEFITTTTHLRPAISDQDNENGNYPREVYQHYDDKDTSEAHPIDVRAIEYPK
mmetsp:Transcript_29590/g.55359  ORF Transcript_29590/g.55359 Transcript_29590/m.55359 type:complete len:83 (-) Transcript_29590:429-677(-)